MYPNERKVIKTKNQIIIEMESGYDVQIIIDGERDLGRQGAQKDEFVRREF